MEWRPIETCPKGTQVLLYEPEVAAGRLVLPARIVVGTFPTLYPRTPTHWLPLPAPPTAE
jgi:hypothetical protein